MPGSAFEARIWGELESGPSHILIPKVMINRTLRGMVPEQSGLQTIIYTLFCKIREHYYPHMYCMSTLPGAQEGTKCKADSDQALKAMCLWGSDLRSFSFEEPKYRHPRAWFLEELNTSKSNCKHLKLDAHESRYSNSEAIFNSLAHVYCQWLYRKSVADRNGAIPGL